MMCTHVKMLHNVEYIAVLLQSLCCPPMKHDVNPRIFVSTGLCDRGGR